jgi:hypothetical protein
MDAVGDRQGPVTALPGAAEALNTLRDNGIKVFMTGFAPATGGALLAHLRWIPLLGLGSSPRRRRTT